MTETSPPAPQKSGYRTAAVRSGRVAHPAWPRCRSHRRIAVTGREIADAWQRIIRSLQHNAPDSYAALRAGASPADIAALESGLGVQIPVELRILWSLTAGDDGANGWGCLPGNRPLMTLDAVAAAYRLKMNSQADQDTLNADRPEEERITVWKPTWIPVVALGPADSTSGLYLDAANGHLGRWSRYNEAPGDELDTLVTYLEEAADMLEAPALATRDKPGPRQRPRHPRRDPVQQRLAFLPPLGRRAPVRHFPHAVDFSCTVNASLKAGDFFGGPHGTAFNDTDDLPSVFPPHADPARRRPPRRGVAHARRRHGPVPRQ